MTPAAGIQHTSARDTNSRTAGVSIYGPAPTRFPPGAAFLISGQRWGGASRAQKGDPPPLPRLRLGLFLGKIMRLATSFLALAAVMALCGADVEAYCLAPAEEGRGA